jgi:hypothetical protein
MGSTLNRLSQPSATFLMCSINTALIPTCFEDVAGAVKDLIREGKVYAQGGYEAAFGT